MIFVNLAVVIFGILCVFYGYSEYLLEKRHQASLNKYDKAGYVGPIVCISLGILCVIMGIISYLVVKQSEIMDSERA